MKHVEAVIKMLSPDFNVRSILIRRRHKGNAWFKRGTLFRNAIDTLRNAALPLPQYFKRQYGNGSDQHFGRASGCYQMSALGHLRT
jgi:hypothetical protein